MGDKCKRHPSVRDKSCGPRHPEWETSVGDKWNKCKLMQGTQWETSGKTSGETSVNSCGPRHPEWETSVGDKWETSVNSCGPRHPRVGDKCKMMETQVGRQV